MRQFLVFTFLAFYLISVPVFANDSSIKIGVSLPLSGEIASYGDDIHAGIDLAVSDINAQGGVNGKKLEPLFEDDAADPKTGVAVANRFLGEKVDAVINAVSRTSLAIAPIYAEENVPFLNLASTDAITEHGWGNVIRVVPKNGQEGPRLAELIGKKASGHKLAMLYASEEYSANLTENAMKILAGKKITPDFTMKISDKDQDFSSIISRLKDQKIDVVFLGFWPKSTGLFLRQSVAAGYHPVFISDYTASMDDLVKIAGPAAETIAFTSTPDPQYVASAKSVVDALAARHVVNRPFAIWGYLLVQVYAAAVQKAGTTDYNKILHTLKTGNFTTAMGNVSFTDNGDMKGIDFEYYTWKNGKIAPLP